jgi:hypothetical protein
MAGQGEIQGWLSGRIPADWTTGGTPEILVDANEILAIVRLADVQAPEGGDTDAARLGRIQQYREETREDRMRIAEEAQAKYGRPVSWGAECGNIRQLFTHLSLPVMTRLRITDRQVLDALVDAGIARSRSHALAWCVRLVRQHQADWFKELREAMESVQRVRAHGPKLH